MFVLFIFPTKYQQRDELDQKVVKCIFTGDPSLQKGYKHYLHGKDEKQFVTVGYFAWRRVRGVLFCLAFRFSLHHKVYKFIKWLLVASLQLQMLSRIATGRSRLEIVERETRLEDYM